MIDKQALIVGLLFFALAANMIVLYTKVAVLSTHVEALETAAKLRAERARGIP
jgi:hypothetical protein